MTKTAFTNYYLKARVTDCTIYIFLYPQLTEYSSTYLGRVESLIDFTKEQREKESCLYASPSAWFGQ